MTEKLYEGSMCIIRREREPKPHRDRASIYVRCKLQSKIWKSGTIISPHTLRRERGEEESNYRAASRNVYSRCAVPTAHDWNWKHWLLAEWVLWKEQFPNHGIIAPSGDLLTPIHMRELSIVVHGSHTLFCTLKLIIREQFDKPYSYNRSQYKNLVDQLGEGGAEFKYCSDPKNQDHYYLGCSESFQITIWSVFTWP